MRDISDNFHIRFYCFLRNLFDAYAIYVCGNKYLTYKVVLLHTGYAYTFILLITMHSTWYILYLRYIPDYIYIKYFII